jgi:dihydroneopterin aldolase
LVLEAIHVSNIRLYAHHGCLKEERIIGSDYRVDVVVKADLQEASSSDDLKDTADYVRIYAIVVEEMKIPSNLIEHVAKRISDRILLEIPITIKGTITVSKINPPIGGDVEMVSVIHRFSR